MEIRSFRYFKKFYPYEIMEVHVGKGRNQLDFIHIKKSFPYQGKTIWNENITTVSRSLVAEEEFAHLEHFLSEKIEKIHQEKLEPIQGYVYGIDITERFKWETYRWHLLSILLGALVAVVILGLLGYT